MCHGVKFVKCLRRHVDFRSLYPSTGSRVRSVLCIAVWYLLHVSSFLSWDEIYTRGAIFFSQKLPLEAFYSCGGFGINVGTMELQVGNGFMCLESSNGYSDKGDLSDKHEAI